MLEESRGNSQCDQRGLRNHTDIPAGIHQRSQHHVPQNCRPFLVRRKKSVFPHFHDYLMEKRGERDAFTDEVLLDPETSLLYGGWYIRYLMDEFGGDFTCAVAAYHAGQGAVRKWLKDPAYSPDGRTLSVFPTDAPKTGHYVSKVRKAYDYYLKKYR